MDVPITLIAGPMSSDSLLALAPNATNFMQLLVSYGSTNPASEFSMKDHFFRVLPDDSRALFRIRDQMIFDGITSVVIVYPSDSRGTALYNIARNQLMEVAKHGYNFMLNSESYDKTFSTAVDFISTASSLNNKVQTAIEQSGRSRVAVFAVGREEVAALMEASSDTLRGCLKSLSVARIVDNGG